MAEFANTPPMDEILASIRRIITEDKPIDERRDAAAVAVPMDDGDGEDVLELGEAIAAPVDAPVPAPPPVFPAAPTREAGRPDLLSEQTQAATQRALATLSGLTIDPNAGANTLDGMVREMVRPMLKEWLDAHLPEIVERLVSREVARLSGR